MIKRFVLPCAALAVLSSACSTPAAAAPADLCDVLPAADLAKEFGDGVTVTKRLISEPESPWAYCLYGTATEHYLTLGAPLRKVIGNVRVLPGPDTETAVAEEFEQSANDRVPAGYTVDTIDIPTECTALLKAAESVVGRVTHARGTADATSLTCDFIGEDGSIAAQTRPVAFASSADLIGVEIIDEPDAKLKGVKTAKRLDVKGIVDHSQVTITITPTTGYTSAGLSDSEEAFARRFLDASW